MKKNLFTALFLSLLSISLFAQKAYEGIKYQAVLRDAGGVLLSSKQIALRISIYQKTNQGAAYIEDHAIITNVMGMINISVGRGIPRKNSFSGIAWEQAQSDPFFIKVELDENQSGNFRNMGESELLSVPYALYAKYVDNVDDADADPTNELQDLKLNGHNLEVTGISTPTIINLSPYLDNTDQQILSLTNDTLYLTNGGKVFMGIFDLRNRFTSLEALVRADSIYLHGLITDSVNFFSQRIHLLQDTVASHNQRIQSLQGQITLNTDSLARHNVRLRLLEDSLARHNTRLNIQAFDILSNTALIYAHIADDKDTSSNNELQVISRSNDTLFLSKGGGFVVLPGGLVNYDNDSTNELITGCLISNDTLQIQEAGNTYKISFRHFAKRQEMLDTAMAIRSDISDLQDTTAALRTDLDANTTNLAAHIAADMDTDTLNEIQTLSQSNDTIYLDKSGGYVVLPVSGPNTWDTNGTSVFLPYGQNVAIRTDSARSAFQIDEYGHIYNFATSSDTGLIISYNLDESLKYSQDGNSTLLFMGEDGFQMLHLKNKTAGSAIGGIHSQIVLDKNGLAINNENAAAALDIYPKDSMGLILNSTPYGAPQLLLYDSSGSNFTALRAASTLNQDIRFTLPNNAGNSGELLATDGDGNLFWSVVTLTCPVGMTGIQGAFCIDSTERTSANWFIADSTCAALGYKLADFGDWYGAMSNSILSAEDDNWEWTSNISQNNMMVVGNSSVGLPGIRQRAFRDPQTDTAPYRCTYRR